MSQHPANTVAYLADLFKTLIAPIVLFSLAIFMMVWDGVVDPPTELQGMSGLALVLVAISTGLGADLLEKRGGKA